MGNFKENFMSGVKMIVPEPIRRRILSRNQKSTRIKRREIFEKHLRRSDVFLVGHPKSGNTWLAYMLAILTNNDAERKINISNVGEFVPTIHANDYRISEFGNLTSPRVFRNEGPRFPGEYPKTIYILRDPRAVFLSYYHHCVHDTSRSQWSIKEFVDEMIENGCIKELEPYIVRWDKQVADWSNRQKEQRVYFVKYEDLKNDCGAVLKEICSFIGLDSDAEAIASAVERGSFSNMRKDEEKHGAESFPGEKGKKGFFVRKGKVDSWKEEMPEDVIQKINESFGSVMKKFGYLE